MDQQSKLAILSRQAQNGLVLRSTLEGDKNWIARPEWSPDGRFIAAPSSDKTIRLWDVVGEKLVKILKGHSNWVVTVAWSPNARLLASGSHDDTVIIWDVSGGFIRNKLTGHSAPIASVAWSPKGDILATGAADKRIILWEVESWKKSATLEFHEGTVSGLAWSPGGDMLASASYDNLVSVWDPKYARPICKLKGHTNQVTSVAWSRDGGLLATGSYDNTIRIWDMKSKREKTVLEGHVDWVNFVSFSAGDELLASKSRDGLVLIWRAKGWDIVAVIDEPAHKIASHGLSFHPAGLLLATLGSEDRNIRIWDLDVRQLANSGLAVESVHYVTAKIVLVGDSGVGKTGLGWRLAHGEYKEHSSTHGQQFWVIEDLRAKRKDGTECEAVLWDLAGQPDYRLVHSLFLDNIDLALLLFDPTNREKPLGGVEFWLKQLSHIRSRPRSIVLIGSRVDRGTSTLTRKDLEDYCRRNEIAGGYIAVSSKSGEGLEELVRKLKSQVKWEEIPTIVTTRTFKVIKEYVLSLKEDGGRGGVLVSPDQLRKSLVKSDEGLEFGYDEMMTAVEHLATHGYVVIIPRSSGSRSILLAPEILVNLASSFILEARRNARGLGVLEEEQLLLGGYPFPELVSLSREERVILLDAVSVLFLEHNVCFRGTFNDRTFLVFPSLINEKKPRFDDVDVVDDYSYHVSGAVENSYAALVVLLGYTNTFTRINQWQNQAQYELGQSEVCGFRQINEREGEIELILYYGVETPVETRQLFRAMFERFLKKRDVTITRYPPVVCTKCQKLQERSVVVNLVQERKDKIYCNRCGKQLKLPAVNDSPLLSSSKARTVDAEQAVAARRTAFEVALVRIKALVRESRPQKRPTCFVSYAWGVPEHERWTMTLAKDLRNAGLSVTFDKWHCLPGISLSEYVEKIESSDYVIAIGTPKYKNKYLDEEADAVVAAEIRMINSLLMKRKSVRERVMPLLLEGTQKTSFPPIFGDFVYIDFRAPDDYFVRLFDLIVRLCSISAESSGLEELRATMV